MDEILAAFLKVLDPSDNSTGGGTASAVAGAMAAALVGMVSRLSVGREGMAEDAFYEKITAEAEGLSEELFRGGWEDSEAFKAVMLGFKMPKKTNEQRSRRRIRLAGRNRATSMLRATATPAGMTRNGSTSARLWSGNAHEPPLVLP